MITRFFAFTVLVFLCKVVQAQVTFHITNIPVKTPDTATIYFAGSPNNWNPGDVNFRFQKAADKTFWITIPAGTGSFEYKCTRGDWTTVEGNETGSFRPNRKYTYGNGDTINISILSWEDLGGGASSTANNQVTLWQSKMYVPELNRFKKIWVYLPQNYSDTTKRFRVLYMHDGQNVFDASTSFAGEWKVDETLTSMENAGKESAIVIAIENGGTNRINEYSPFVNAQYGGGEGDKYLDFIINTLKPKVDSTFRTLQGPANTGIMGSSMGGLISHYAHFKYPGVFGRAGLISPAYWFSNEFEAQAKKVGLIGDPRLYLLAGSNEKQIAQGTNQMSEVFEGLGFTENTLKTRVVSDGEHAEWFWAREFEDVFSWLFNEKNLFVEKVSNTNNIRVYPNPTTQLLNVEGKGVMQIRITNSIGRTYSDTIQEFGIVNLDKQGWADTDKIFFLEVTIDKKTELFKIIRE